MMTVVVGPPCAGKSTYVSRMAQPGDVVVDFDSIANELGSPAEFDHPATLIPAIQRVRAERIAECLADSSVASWVILTYMPQAAGLGIPGTTRAVVLNPGIGVCLERARRARRSAQVIKTIRDWTPAGPREYGRKR